MATNNAVNTNLSGQMGTGLVIVLWRIALGTGFNTDPNNAYMN